jgi:hypothetical protein
MMYLNAIYLLQPILATVHLATSISFLTGNPANQQSLFASMAPNREARAMLLRATPYPQVTRLGGIRGSYRKVVLRLLTIEIALQ